MLWHLLKYYLGFVIAVYFKRSQIKNARFLKVKGPVIIAMNHPNAFMDPVAFSALIYPPKVQYLARGDAFKKGIVKTILQSIGVIPIYRLQDGGKEGLKKNDETYDIVNTLLKKNKKIIIFAEGICIQERRLRPLKKGVPRMVFGAMETNQVDNLTVVPVGVNYTNPSQFRGSVFFNVGKPIKMVEYMSAYKDAPAKTMNQFLADLAPRMKELIVHINHTRSEKVIEHIEEVYKYSYFEKEKLNPENLEHDFLFSTKVTDAINKAEETHPEKVISLAEKTSHYFAELKKYNIKDWLLSPTKKSAINYGNFSLRLLLIILTFPVYVRGLLASWLSYRLTYLITKKLVRVVEFKASFNMGIGAVLFLLYYNLQFFIAKALAPNAWWALLVLFISVLSSLFCLWLSPFRKKTWGMLRVLKMKSSNSKKFDDLLNQRKEIISLIEELV
ncbi:MAG: 1-acyl-sn-glycerol-3-phosphate acyltransferase [Burkholderiales bacterium]|nr:1-acyl-sn-glycerol-3-phosphate acyltransferase [Bacteroidia bacterium]